MKGLGYVGYGEVTEEATMIRDFQVNGKSLLEQPLRAPKASENKNDPDYAEWAVGVNWLKTYPRDNAQHFKGIFANQNIVCKLRDSQTIDFLENRFDVSQFT